MTPDNKIKAAHFIKTLIEEGQGLTNWEEDFVASVEEQMEKISSLSDKQLEVLERVYANKTP